MSELSAGFMAFRFAGRFMVTQAMPSSNSTITFSQCGSSFFRASGGIRSSMYQFA
jgi:hypothetical protein